MIVEKTQNMKNTRLLRDLSLLGFLLLLAPFYDSCDGKGFFVRTYDECDINGKPIEKTFYKKVYNVVVDELSFNGFEIAQMTIFAFQEVTFQEFKKEFPKEFHKKDWFKNLGFFISLLFDFIVLITFSMIIISCFKKDIILRKLALTNCILIIATFLYIILLESSFKHFNQIKWGYYAFLITNILIYYYSSPKFQTS